MTMTSNVLPDVDEVPGRTGVLASMCLALVLVVASVSSVNLALTAISIDLKTTSTQLTWVADGYTVALAAFVLPFGALGDRFGRRTLLMLGTALFGLAALAASLAQSPEALIGCRVGMGLGAALILPGTLSTITAVFPPSKRAEAVGVWAGFASSGGILGLLACGLVLEWSSWRATFAGAAALALVSLIAAWRLTPNTADPEEAVLDLPGSALAAIGVGSLVYGIIEGAEAGWTSGSTLAGLAVSAASLVAFVLWELYTSRPMLDVRLFANRAFSAGTLAITVQFLCVFGFFLVAMQFLLLMLGYSPLHSALALLPMAAVVMPLSRMAPRLAERIGERSVITAGLLLVAVGLAVIALLDSSSGYWHFLAGVLVFGAGMGLVSTPSTTVIVSSLPAAKQGVASAVNDVAREVGAAVGIAVLGSMFSSGYSSAVRASVGGLPPEAAHAVEASAGAGFAVAEQLGRSGEQLGDAVKDAFASGLGAAMVAGTALALVAALLVAWWAPRRRHASETTVATSEEPTAIVPDQIGLVA